MRITRDLLIKLAKDTVKQRTDADHSIIAAFLVGAVREMDDPFLGGTADIDLLFICRNEPPTTREIVRLSPEVTLDIAFHSESSYDPPRKLRADPLRGYLMYDPMLLFEQKHFFEYAQAIVRAGFDDPANVLARVRSHAVRARQMWMELQLGAGNPGAPELTKYLAALEQAADAVAAFSGPPLNERRFLQNFDACAKTAGKPELNDALLTLLGAPQFDPALALSWLPEWESALGVAIDRKVDAAIHPARIPYYRKAIELFLASPQPAAALWPLLRTWTTSAACMSELRQPSRAWQEAVEQLGLTGAALESHLSALDRYLDAIEELMERYASSNGLSESVL